MKNLLFLIGFGVLFAGCQQKPSLKDFMTDTWETTYVKIEMPTFQASDSTHVFEDDFKNNPPRRARSHYKADGTYISWYITPTGEMLGENPGTWSIMGDSLYIQYEYEGKQNSIAYHIKMLEDGFEGRSKHDWDVDNEFDDLLYMKTKRIILDE